MDLPTGTEIEGPLETTYFAGCGYAVRSDVYENIPKHPETFVYGAYEDDLAFRIHQTDYTIQYLPSVTVIHKRSPEGTLPDKERWKMSYTNNVAVAVRHLPWRYVILNTVLWGGATFLRTKFSLLHTLEAIKELIEQRDIHLEAGDVVERETISYIKRKGGRLY